MFAAPQRWWVERTGEWAAAASDGGDLEEVVVAAGDQADGDTEVVVVGADEERVAGSHADAAGGERHGGRAFLADPHPEVDAVAAGGRHVLGGQHV